MLGPGVGVEAGVRELVELGVEQGVVVSGVLSGVNKLLGGECNGWFAGAELQLKGTSLFS